VISFEFSGHGPVTGKLRHFDHGVLGIVSPRALKSLDRLCELFKFQMYVHAKPKPKTCFETVCAYF
jgi:hypothetical protein